MDGNRVLGPGAADMNRHAAVHLSCSLCSGGAAGTQALHCAQLRRGDRLSKFRRRIRELASHATYCFDLEPGRSDGSYVKTRKGVRRLSIKLHGKSAHAGVNPDDGASAVVELGKVDRRFADPARRDNGYRVNFGVIKGGTAYNVVS